MKQISSTQIIYSEHGIDECFEYIAKHQRVEDGIAVGYLDYVFPDDVSPTKLILFNDIQYSSYDHQYWDNYELEHDADRVILP